MSETLKEYIRVVVEGEGAIGARRTRSRSLNEGDIVEGIFAIVVALNIAEDTVRPEMVERWRRRIEPALYRKERQIEVISDYSNLETKDRIKVVLEMRLKSPKTVAGSFGNEYSSINDVPSIARKQAALIQQIEGSSALKRIRQFKEEILSNGRRDAVVFTVIADGLAGETSGGNLKGDVMIRVQSSESASGDLEDIVGSETQEIAFSLKSDSKTVANMSVYRGLISLAEAWGIHDFLENVELYARVLDRQADKKEKAKLIAAMFADFAERLDAMDKTPEFSKRVIEFISGSIFGDDLADVVDITGSGIKEVTMQGFAKLIEQGLTFDVVIGRQKNGNPVIHFYQTGNQSASGKLFHLRTKIRVDENGNLKEAKLYPELGPMAYLIGKPNYQN